MKNKLIIAKQFILDSVAEAKKVTWPNRKQLVEHSAVVVGAIIVALGIIALVDYCLSYIVRSYIFGV